MILELNVEGEIAFVSMIILFSEFCLDRDHTYDFYSESCLQASLKLTKLLHYYITTCYYQLR